MSKKNIKNAVLKETLGKVEFVKQKMFARGLGILTLIAFVWIYHLIA